MGNGVLALFPNVPDVVFTVFASAIALTIAISFVAFHGLWIKGPAGAAEEQVSLTARVGTTAQQYGLTKREIEVLQLLAEGRSLPYVQQKLFISEGTARTHIKHIYTKMDVHSKQELLDKVRGE